MSNADAQFIGPFVVVTQHCTEDCPRDGSTYKLPRSIFQPSDSEIVAVSVPGYCDGCGATAEIRRDD